MMTGMATPTRPSSIRGRPNAIRSQPRKTRKDTKKNTSLADSRGPLLPGLPLGQVQPQGVLDRLVRAQQMVIDLGLSRLVAELLAERLEVLQVLAAQLLRVHQQAMVHRLQVAEL